MSLWGSIKGKVKKLGSSSRSRSSRASSGSQDDMSVDSIRRPSRSLEEEEEAPASPAVLRPRLKIRVLTSVDQIVVRTDYERDALELLKKQSYGHAKRFDTKFLMMTGLRQDMNCAFTTVGWSRFAVVTEPGIHCPKMVEIRENPGLPVFRADSLRPPHTRVQYFYWSIVTCS
ncbi:uncharacterized protein LOC120693238 [Panicum virgatum]|uniref:uncharacterized protein LOC120693238 n=1 Tax=Panicum virgatum TaxID=38727 RepID=UPI0019D68903|nr:uncharacterized protein LOC120693238 [Panicum virgatum]